MTEGITCSRWARYCRRLQSGDFSLEANTEAAPETGQFYLLRAGEVLLRSEDFQTVQVAYQGLCREHWERHLISESASQRMTSAWGLLGMEPAHRAATAVIEQDGSVDDVARLARLIGRRRSLDRRAALHARRARS